MKLASFLIPILSIAAIAGVISCSKSGGGAKPTISIKSITTTVANPDSFVVVLNFNSQSGTLGNGTFVAIRNRLNIQPITGGAQPPDTLTQPNGIPNFPNISKGEFRYALPYSFMHESDHINDTVVFKFAAIDRNGKSSDTLVTPKIVVINP